MNTINLTDLEKSDFKYKISQFPDGQQDIVLDQKFVIEKGLYFPIRIASRFNSFRDLELIIATKKALDRIGIREVHLYIPYLLGARSDIQFQEGGTSYLVDVIAPIINSLEFDSVTVLDVHSTVAAGCIRKLKNTPGTALMPSRDTEYILVCPDAGAMKRTYDIAKRIGYNREILVAMKHRDVITGNITKTEIPSITVRDVKEFIIVDDICDGGRTFIELAKILKNYYPKAELYLVVSHGIFSAGLKELTSYFDCIYTTNSVFNVSEGEFAMRNERYLDRVKQLNIF
jgi:ribose-phosphate pyrophosphokinase